MCLLSLVIHTEQLKVPYHGFIECFIVLQLQSHIIVKYIYSVFSL